MNKYLRWGMRLIGPLLLIFILSRTDLASIGAALSQIDIWPLLLSLALMPVFVLVKSWRWNMLMRELGITPPSLWYSAALYCIGLFYGSATPGQSGDFLKAVYLRDRGPAAPVLFSILIDRLFDFMIMAPLALLTLVAFQGIVPASAVPVAVVGAVVFILATPLMMARGVRNWGMNLIQPLLPGKLRAMLEKWRGQLDVLTLRPGLMVNLLVASVCSAASTMARIWALYMAMRLYNVDLLAIIGSTALIALLQTLPISFSGVGVRDAVLLAVLAAYGYSDPSVAIALSALFLVLNIEHLIVGFLISLRYPLDQQAAAEQAAPKAP
ncbi:flippase-like domain-containing protein [Chloroflexia bacterium SDU3-3]|nr:flippase-like domain-containing protein [Chloroflexia bacterium SDU3-3]